MLTTERFILKQLGPDFEDYSNYLTWMTNKEINPFILTANASLTEIELRQYVLEKYYAPDASLFGIFDKIAGTHIGNIKLEPIILNESAFIGILIGETKWRRQGVGFEVLSRIIHYSFTELDLRVLYLGVDVKNLSAIGLYKKLGFDFTKNFGETRGDLRMKLLRL